MTTLEEIEKMVKFMKERAEWEGSEKPSFRWCECPEGKGFDNAYYVPDNTPHAMIAKHHWVCSECRGIVQIG